jgi:DNA-binding transcriptional regulator YiaG
MEETEKEYCQLPLTNGGFAIVDKEDFKELSKHKWWKNKRGYVYGTDREFKEAGYGSLHRFVNKTPKGFHTHHINGDISDNRKCNLVSLIPQEHTHYKANYDNFFDDSTVNPETFVTFDRMEILRNKLGMDVKAFCKILGVNRGTYYSWKYCGISGVVQKLIKVMEHNPGAVINVVLFGISNPPNVVQDILDFMDKDIKKMEQEKLKAVNR